MSKHALTNLASRHAFEIDVAVGEDATAVAKEYLVDQGLSEHDQAGFYVSVFPTAEGTDDVVANPPSNLDSSPNDTPWDPQA